MTASRQPTRKCLGFRPYNPTTRTYGQYQWMDYGTVQKRRANFGVGIVEVNKLAGVTEEKYGIGLWCQNRPEWQITGKCINKFETDHQFILFRFGMHVTIVIYRLVIRNIGSCGNRIHHQSCYLTLYCNFLDSHSHFAQAEARTTLLESHHITRPSR